MVLQEIVDLETYPIFDQSFGAKCRVKLDESGVLIMPGFATPAMIEEVRAQGDATRDQVYSSAKEHTVYLSQKDPNFSPDHPRNRLVTSSKGCITDDVFSKNSPLRELYDSPSFKAFLCSVLGEENLYPYADSLSSINLHYAEKGEELGWHFDNSSFAITLMIQETEKGGEFEYVGNVRDADAGEMSFDTVGDILDGKIKVEKITARAGTLVLFRGRNSLHRVTPNEGKKTRMLAVLAYNSEPGISLSKEAQMTFYGRSE